ncbi:hypothetical protein ATO12_20925 [Aquimarina atlantica]|uniref:Uncharacterized protein n=1 Tax=Aquimarina atlantica TaxID=1317122 RepID=A0A023BRJ9_9FLAO|nr:hypothetical protein [Aquimarina atlantica]EZH72602.1 hypothetical protein ATO12_20925 [Aquimarina atlantica]
MKTIHNINKWSFIITLILYLTIYYGLLAQIFLGGIQVTLAITLFMYWRKFNNQQKKHLLIYSCLTIIYGLLCLTDIMNSDFAPIFLFIIPMTIAGYFVYTTYKIKKISYEFKYNSI